MVRYTLTDAKQAAIGAVVATILFFAIRGGTPGPFIDAQVGLGIFALWAYLLYKPFKRQKGKDTVDFFLNIGVVAAVTTTFALLFGLATTEQLYGFVWFGSPAMIAALLGMPIALIFDFSNLTSPMSRYYISRRR